MPNGRSGGFIIERADLGRFLKTISDKTEVGKIVVCAAPLRPVSAAEVTRLVEECPNKRIAVEEQDHKCYIIHLQNEPEIVWVAVTQETPIFQELRQLHVRWMTEHPDWLGWVAF